VNILVDRILLVDVDGKIPNLALMKISTYHKNNGDFVKLIKLNLDYYSKQMNKKIIYANEFNKVYISTIFKINKDVVKIIDCDNVLNGGVGYDLEVKLSPEFDNLEPDYSIYPDNDKSYGFITRGCIRNCSFCVVPKKEGFIYKYRNIDDIVKHKQVIFMDNNILAYKEHLLILKELVDKKIRCCFNQGLDIRLINDDNAKLLSQIKYIGEYVFAFDDYKLKDLIVDKLTILNKYIEKDWKLKFFIYCHPNMDIFNDVVFRINFCKEHKILPYIMRDESCWSSENNNFYIDITSWCNQPAFFKKLSFEEFMNKRTKNKERILNSIRLFKGENYVKNF
jgi:hypothetical protein